MSSILKNGDTFGSWTVVSLKNDSTTSNRGKESPSRWKYLCQCECGFQKTKYAFQLINGDTISCGCKDLKRKHPKYLKSGEVFGKLTVLDVDPKSKIKNGKYVYPSHWKYICSCECGNVTRVPISRLVQGITSSCGCLKFKRNKKRNPIKICGKFTIILFYNSNKEAYIDSEDYYKVQDRCWHVVERRGAFYVETYGLEGENAVVSLHNVILPTESGLIVDHIDGNGLNNKKENLRIATYSQNAMNRRLSSNNTSGVTGVSYSKKGKAYIAEITINGVKIYLGSFKSKKDAIKARKEAEEKYFKDRSFDNSRGINE